MGVVAIGRVRAGLVALVRTDLIELDGVVLGAQLGEQRLGGAAVGAVRLAEDGCF